MRLVIRIGGSVVASPVNTELMKTYAQLIKTINEKGHQVAVVVGGGSLAREFIAIAKQLGLNMIYQDEIAISCSRLYAQLFLQQLGDAACKKVAVTLDEAEACQKEGKIIVMGGLKPGITTDTVAALVAERLDSELLVKGTDQEGVYDKDPRKFSDAVKLDHLSFDDLAKLLEFCEHKAGLHQVIDPMAIEVLKRKKLRLIVFNGFKPENLLAAVNGVSVGTLIC